MIVLKVGSVSSKKPNLATCSLVIEVIQKRKLALFLLVGKFVILKIFWHCSDSGD